MLRHSSCRPATKAKSGIRSHAAGWWSTQAQVVSRPTEPILCMGFYHSVYHLDAWFGGYGAVIQVDLKDLMWAQMDCFESKSACEAMRMCIMRRAWRNPLLFNIISESQSPRWLRVTCWFTTTMPHSGIWIFANPHYEPAIHKHSHTHTHRQRNDSNLIFCLNWLRITCVTANTAHACRYKHDEQTPFDEFARWLRISTHSTWIRVRALGRGREGGKRKAAENCIALNNNMWARSQRHCYNFHHFFNKFSPISICTHGMTLAHTMLIPRT